MAIHSLCKTLWVAGGFSTGRASFGKFHVKGTLGIAIACAKGGKANVHLRCSQALWITVDNSAFLCVKGEGRGVRLGVVLWAGEYGP